jgi:hypothetical protein
MFRKSFLQPFVWCRRFDKSIEENGTIALGQHDGFVPGDGLACSLRQRDHAEIRELAPLKLCGSLNQRFGRLVDAEAKSFFTKPMLTFGLTLQVF